MLWVLERGKSQFEGLPLDKTRTWKYERQEKEKEKGRQCERKQKAQRDH
jgi:hypothetical protein